MTDPKQAAELIHGDCLDVLRGMEAASVDAIVTDPPYGLGTREPSIEEIIAYLGGGTPTVIASSKSGRDATERSRNQSGPSTTSAAPTASSANPSRFFPRFALDEDDWAFLYAAKASRSERGAGCDGLKASHPTVKPLALMRWLVRLACPSGGLVLDHYSGSGTTGVAALKEGRRFVGIEREAEYVAISRARLEHAGQREAGALAETTKQGSLF